MSTAGLACAYYWYETIVGISARTPILPMTRHVICYYNAGRA